MLRVDVSDADEKDYCLLFDEARVRLCNTRSAAVCVCVCVCVMYHRLSTV